MSPYFHYQTHKSPLIDFLVPVILSSSLNWSIFLHRCFPLQLIEACNPHGILTDPIYPTLDWPLPPFSRHFCSLPLMFSSQFVPWYSVLRTTELISLFSFVIQV